MKKDLSTKSKLIKMTVPTWFCPVICSGLSTIELIPKYKNNSLIEFNKINK
jgi:hypothetical protein